MNIIFLWKPVYISKKDRIDGICNKVGKTISDAISKVDSYIPKYKDHELKTE